MPLFLTVPSSEAMEQIPYRLIQASVFSMITMTPLSAGTLRKRVLISAFINKRHLLGMLSQPWSNGLEQGAY